MAVKSRRRVTFMRRQATYKTAMLATLLHSLLVLVPPVPQERGNDADLRRSQTATRPR
jgi:hypothetical protein